MVVAPLEMVKLSTSNFGVRSLITAFPGDRPRLRETAQCPQRGIAGAGRYSGSAAGRKRYDQADPQAGAPSVPGPHSKGLRAQLPTHKYCASLASGTIEIFISFPTPCGRGTCVVDMGVNVFVLFPPRLGGAGQGQRSSQLPQLNQSAMTDRPCSSDHTRAMGSRPYSGEAQGVRAVVGVNHWTVTDGGERSPSLLLRNSRYHTNY